MAGIDYFRKFIPAMLFGLLSIKLISPKTKLRNTGWVIGALFLALITLGTYFGFSMAKCS
jgi:hypothetical protein